MIDQITRGRAYVRLIEAADVLLAGSQPPTVTAQILAASQDINAPAGEFGKN